MPIQQYLLDRISNKKYRLNGILPSTRESCFAQLREQFSDHMKLNESQLPHKVDLRSEMTPVEAQSTVASCVANAFAGAYEYLLQKTSGRHIDVSRLFIYYNARAQEEKSPEHISDSGCHVTSALETLKELGTCEESLWPYDISCVNVRPNSKSYERAADNQIIDALQLKTDLHEMKACLAQGYPFIFGLQLFKSFDIAEKKGHVPMPHAGDMNRESHGRHAMLAVGYSDHSNAFIVRNSWGTDWGDKGYCYIPYAYMTNQDLCFEACTVRKLEADDIGHDDWDDDDSVDLYGIDDEEDNDDDYDIVEEEEEEEGEGEGEGEEEEEEEEEEGNDGGDEQWNYE